MAKPTSRVLSSSQLATLAKHGEERSAEVGEKLFEIGDKTYPFIAVIEGRVAVLDGAGREIVSHGASGFLGEMNLLSGQTVFLTAVVTEPMRYIAVDREELRRLLFEDGSLSDLLLSAFIERRELLQQRDGIGLEIVGPHDSAETRRLLDFARRLRLPHSWLAPEESAEVAALIERTDPDELPIVRLPGGAELRRPTNGELSRALGIGLELEQREEVDLLVIGGGPAGLGAAVYGASEGLDTLVIESTVLGGQAGTSRRIENYLGFPAGISGTELTSRAVSQARKFGARTATAYRARGVEPGDDRHLVTLEDGNEIAARAVVLATGAEYRRLPVESLDSYEGISVFYAAGPPEAHLCGAQRVGVIGGGNSAAQAAVWLARGGALVTLLHRRADLARDDVQLPDRRARALRGRRPRSQRSQRPAWRGRQARGRHPHRRRPACISRSSSSSSAPPPAPIGSATSSPATRTGSSSPAPTPAPRGCSRPASPASTPPATCARGRSSAARPRSARGRRLFASSTSEFPPAGATVG